MKQFFKMYGVALLVIVWNSTSFLLLLDLVSADYGRAMRYFLLSAMMIASLFVTVWCVSFMTECHLGKNSYWSVLRNTWLYVPTIVLFVIYMGLVFMKEISFLLYVANQKQNLWADNGYVLGIKHFCVNASGHVLHLELMAKRFVEFWFVLLTLIQYYLVVRAKDDSQTKLQEQGKKIDDLQLQLDTVTSYSQDGLKNQLNLSVQMREKALRLHDDSLLQFPGVIVTDSQWDEFLTRFNTCNGDLLTRWRNLYPKLTDTDMLYLVLCLMGKSSHEISLLLDSTDRTVWNRRQLVKEHLGIELSELEDWLKETC